MRPKQKSINYSSLPQGEKNQEPVFMIRQEHMSPEEQEWGHVRTPFP